MGKAKKPLIALLLLLSFITLGIWQRHLLIFSPWSSGEAPPLLAMPDEIAPGSYWYDDYFLVEPIDSTTFAIAEPRYPQLNYSYLILGEERAILFDAGPGFRDIRPVTRSLTDLPLTFIPSHFHFDHIGNEITFENVAVVDLPYLRSRATNNFLTLTWQEHLGSGEGYAIPVLEIDEWLAPDSVIDVGGRQLQVLHTPGHTTDSVSLLDLASGAIFSGDFLYPGNLYAFLPTSHMGEYLAGTDTVLAAAADDVILYGAHRGPEPVIPQLNKQDVEDLRSALIRIHDGDLDGIGTYPVSFPVNERLSILAEPRWVQSW